MVGGPPRSRDARGPVARGRFLEDDPFASSEFFDGAPCGGAQMTDAGRKRRGRPEGRFYPLMGRRALRSVARASVRPDGLAVARGPQGPLLRRRGPRRARAAPGGRTCGAARRPRGRAARRSPRKTAERILAPTEPPSRAPSPPPPSGLQARLPRAPPPPGPSLQLLRLPAPLRGVLSRGTSPSGCATPRAHRGGLPGPGPRPRPAGAGSEPMPMGG